MPTVPEFKTAIATEDEEAIIDRFLLTDVSAHVSEPQKVAIRQRLAADFGVPEEDVRVQITGSAHLGFSLIFKREGRVRLLPYRPFSARSDIDVAVISGPIWRLIWKELSDYSHRQMPFPWTAARLGDYLVCGWLRPDHFPKVRLRHCDTWWNSFRTLSTDTTYGRRKVRGGLFYSEQHLRDYMKRALSDAKRRQYLR